MGPAGLAGPPGEAGREVRMLSDFTQTVALLRIDLPLIHIYFQYQGLKQSSSTENLRGFLHHLHSITIMISMIHSTRVNVNIKTKNSTL